MTVEICKDMACCILDESGKSIVSSMTFKDVPSKARHNFWIYIDRRKVCSFGHEPIYFDSDCT